MTSTSTTSSIPFTFQGQLRHPLQPIPPFEEVTPVLPPRYFTQAIGEDGGSSWNTI